MKASIFEAIESSPLIPAVKNDEGLEKSLTCDQGVIFVLYGDVCGIGGIVEKIRQQGKRAIVHADLVAGLGSKEAAVDYLHQIGADGIISTRPAFIKRGCSPFTGSSSLIPCPSRTWPRARPSPGRTSWKFCRGSCPRSSPGCARRWRPR